MTTEVAPGRSRRLSAVMRDGETVTPVELFFDLVLVLGLTQCTALMAAEPTWEGLAKGLLVLGVMWWSWVGYAWLTSVVDPEEGVVRIAMFAATAAFLVAGLSIPRAFGDDALVFVPVVYELKVPALGTVAFLAAALTGLIAYETHAYGEARARIRSELRHEG